MTVHPGATLVIYNDDQTIGSLSGGGFVNLPYNSLTTGGNNTSTTFSGVISGSGGLTKAGAGTMTLSGANTYTGATNISGGTLQMGGANALSASTAVTVNSGTTFNLSGYEQTIGSLAGSGNVLLGSATLTTGGNNSSTTFSGAISGSGGLTKNGSGTMTLNGANTYTGATNINGGVLLMGGTNRLSSSTAVTVASGATFDLNNFSQAIGSLAGGGNVETGGGSLTLTVGADNSSTTFSGGISGTGRLTKVGEGTLTLTGTNTYGGMTTVDEGTLRIGSGGSISNSTGMSIGTNGTLDVMNGGAVYVNGLISNSGMIEIATGGTITTGFLFNQGTLINDGTINASVIASSGGTVGGTGTFSSLTIADGGFADPGASPGTMNSTLTAWDSGGTYLWEINSVSGTEGMDPGWDLWNTGTLTIGATDLNPFTISLNTLDSGNNAGFLGSWNASSNYSWLIATSTNGAFADLTGLILDFSGFLNSLSGGYFSLVSGDGGNNLYVNFNAASGPSPVPEPSSLVLLGCAAGGLFAGYRRRRQTNRREHGNADLTRCNSL